MFAFLDPEMQMIHLYPAQSDFILENKTKQKSSQSKLFQNVRFYC